MREGGLARGTGWLVHSHPAFPLLSFPLFSSRLVSSAPHTLLLLPLLLLSCAPAPAPARLYMCMCMRMHSTVGIHPRISYKLAGEMAKRLDVKMQTLFKVKLKGTYLVRSDGSVCSIIFRGLRNRNKVSQVGVYACMRMHGTARARKASVDYSFLHTPPNKRGVMCRRCFVFFKNCATANNYSLFYPMLAVRFLHAAKSLKTRTVSSFPSFFLISFFLCGT